MNNKWLRVNEVLPESGETILTYYYDKPFDVDQFNLLTYYKKGDKLSGEYNERCDLIEDILGKHDRTVEEDGFYLYENGKWRKYADVITHWQPLIAPN